MKLSIVTTLFKSAPFVREFHDRISTEAARITDDYEILFVDDGSPDDALDLVRELIARDPHVRATELSRNFGHHRAMMTGLAHARGEFIFLIDVDLEEDPKWLSEFWSVMKDARADVVFGYQERRKGNAVERIGGAIHWWIIRCLSSYPIPENLVTARLMTRAYVRALVRHREQMTAIGGLWAITGFRQKGVPVAKGFRGDTAYSIQHRVATAFNGITSFSERPLIFVFVSGVSLFFVSVGVALYLIIRHLTGEMLSGWASLIVSVWMLGGLSIASIGLLGLYIARIFIETKRRPYAIVRRVYEHRS